MISFYKQLEFFKLDFVVIKESCIMEVFQFWMWMGRPGSLIYGFKIWLH